MYLENGKIIGHDSVAHELALSIKNGQLAHAYLFSGPSHVGKFTVAKKMAADLLKLSNENELSFHSDVLLFDDDHQSFKIDQVREVVRKVQLSHTSDYFVVLIKNIHRMPIEAQNAFLKTIEEPSRGVIFLLTTDQPQKVLPTIISRVRTYQLNTVDLATIKEKWPEELNAQQLEWSQGKVGWLKYWQDFEEEFEKWKQYYHKIDRIFKGGDLTPHWALVEELQKDPQELSLFLDIMAHYIEGQIKEAAQQQKKEDLNQLVNAFDVFQETRYFIERNVNKKLALENLLLQLKK